MAASGVDDGGAAPAAQPLWPQHRLEEVAAAAAACRWGEVAVALDAGYPPNAKLPATHQSVLHLAALHGHLPTVVRLLAAGADVNSRDLDDWTPAHNAANDGHLDTLVALVEAGADVNATDILGESPVYYAMYTLPCLRFLLTLPQVDVAAVHRFALRRGKGDVAAAAEEVRADAV
jgi:hypothetical protein